MLHLTVTVENAGFEPATPCTSGTCFFSKSTVYYRTLVFIKAHKARIMKIFLAELIDDFSLAKINETNFLSN